MADAYILVRVNEHDVPLARMALHANVKNSADIVFYEDGRQAHYYGDDIWDTTEKRYYLELAVILNSHIASAKAEKEKRQKQ